MGRKGKKAKGIRPPNPERDWGLPSWPSSPPGNKSVRDTGKGACDRTGVLAHVLDGVARLCGDRKTA